jgi:hypothetical protein
LQAQGLEVPDLDGVEPKLGFGRGAVGDLVVVIRGHVALAVAEKTDVVEVGDAKVFLDFLESGGNVAVVDGDVEVVKYIVDCRCYR